MKISPASALELTVAHTSVSVCPRNGTLPPSVLYRMHPNAQMSVRASALRIERICSGAM